MKKTITHHFVSAKQRPPEAIALRFKRQKTWISWTWKDYFRQTEAVAHGLRELGVRPGDRVAILANTCWEWAVLDFAILGLGAITVPIYQSSRADEIEFILNNSQAKILIIEDASQWRKWESLGKRCPSIQRLIPLFGPEVRSDDAAKMTVTWDEMCEQGAKLAADDPTWFIKSCESVEASQTASVVYTSGTTGEPKGVVITHNQIMSEVEAIAKVYPISATDSTLSFLPYAHVLGRVELWLHPYVGFTLNIAESIDRLKRNLSEVKPSVIIGVPRIFEKIYTGVITEIQSHKWLKQALDVLDQDAHDWVPKRLPMSKLIGSAINIPRKLVIDQLLYQRLRAGLGGRLRFAVSGGAPLDRAIGEFFHKAGILILEGYGLTETTAAVVVNRPDSYQFGTVGKPLPGVEVKLAEDGEILLRGGMVMQGYFQNASATEEVLNDGYFRTGDIGEWTDDGFLRITDRKKDLIKTAGGKYVAPQKLEGMIKLNPLVSNVLIHGDRKKYVVALVTLDESRAKAMARSDGWRFRDYRSLTQSSEANHAVRKIIADVNAQLASHETIKSFAILPQDFTIESGELTPSLKVKRRVCDEHYKSTIDGLYA